MKGIVPNAALTHENHTAITTFNMEAKSEYLNTKRLMDRPTSSAGQLTEFIRKKILASDEHGKVILVDNDSEDFVNLQKRIDVLETKLTSVLSIDKSVRNSMTKLMADWDKELQALEHIGRDKLQHSKDHSCRRTVHEQDISELKMEDLSLTRSATATEPPESMEIRDDKKYDGNKDPHSTVTCVLKDEKIPRPLHTSQNKRETLAKNTEDRSLESMSCIVSALDLADSTYGHGSKPVWNAKRVNASSPCSRYSKYKMSKNVCLNSEKDPADIPRVPEGILKSPSSYFKILNQAKTFRDLKRIVADFTRWQGSYHPYTRYSRSKQFSFKSDYSSEILSKPSADRTNASDNIHDYLKAHNDLLGPAPKILDDIFWSGHLIGEIAFQLERRILAYIFKGERVTIEYTILNIEKMVQLHHVTNEETLLQRSKDVFQRLSGTGFKRRRHVSLIIGLTEAYGTYRHVNDVRKVAHEKGWKNHRQLKYDLLQVTPTNLLHDVIVIVDCLIHLARLDNKDIFLW